MKAVVLLLLLSVVATLAISDLSITSSSFSHSVCQPSYDPTDAEKYPCVQPSSKFIYHLGNFKCNIRTQSCLPILKFDPNL
jgi:hypothetical protein